MKKNDKIRIKNFKAFPELQEFDLKGKNLLVYGNNGSGKSSLYWALGLNERQMEMDALIYFKSKGEITSSEYAQKYKVTDRTARTDLNELVEKKLLTKKGETKSSVYVFPIRK